MTTFTLPHVMCDDEAGCDKYDEDYYAQGVDSVQFFDGRETFRPTAESPAPGWVRRNGEDFCPEHHPEQEVAATS